MGEASHPNRSEITTKAAILDKRMRRCGRTKSGHSLVNFGPVDFKRLDFRPARELSHSLGGIPNPMFSFRRLAILLALSLPVMSAVQAQSSSSSSSSVTPD